MANHIAKTVSRQWIYQIEQDDTSLVRILDCQFTVYGSHIRFIHTLNWNNVQKL